MESIRYYATLGAIPLFAACVASLATIALSLVFHFPGF